MKTHVKVLLAFVLFVSGLAAFTGCNTYDDGGRRAGVNQMNALSNPARSFDSQQRVW